MTRHTTLLVLTVLAGYQVCQGQTEVQYSSLGSPNVVESDGITPVPGNNTVEIGYFNSGFDIQGNANNPAALGAAFNQYGSTTILTGNPGNFSGDSTLNNPSYDSQQIYLWIFHTTGNTAPTADFGNVLEYGLYTSAPNSAWLFPVDGSSTTLTTISTGDVNQFVFGTSVVDPVAGPVSLELSPVAVVPEPGVMALLSVGLVLGGFFHRRKR